MTILLRLSPDCTHKTLSKTKKSAWLHIARNQMIENALLLCALRNVMGYSGHTLVGIKSPS